MANWKMQKLASEAKQFIEAFSQKELPSSVDIAICAPFLCLPSLAEQKIIPIGAQNVYPADKGAFTGETSPTMLKEFDVTYVIVGHSERRQILKETDDFVASKFHYCVEEGLTPVLCVGESLEQREAGEAETWCKAQLDAVFKEYEGNFPDDLLIAYEPIWAIGTGKTATAEDAQAMIHALRSHLETLKGQEIADKARFLYGGSVKPANIASLMQCEDIDGALVGGASLEAEDFYQLILEGSANHE